MRRLTPGLLASALLLASVACVSPESGAESAAPTAAPELPETASVQSNAGHYRVSYRFDPAPIPSGELFSMLVWVRDAASGEPAQDIALVVDAGMPQHQHGMNTRPALSQAEDGATRVDDLLFHMPGTWTVTFDIEREGVTERAQVVLDVD